MNLVTVKVWGDYACFTRPENKAERVSYDVMTPSAARGVLEGILWKPQIKYRITQIAVLKPIRHASILRNEVNSLQSPTSAREWAARGGAFDATTDRAQRHSLVLRDVAYVITAELRLTDLAGPDDPPRKYLEMFERRVGKGQAYRTPYLGTREFTADFGPPDEDDRPIEVTTNLGRMLLDIRFDPGGNSNGLRFKQHGPQGSTIVAGNARPYFFPAELVNGVLRVPQAEYERMEASA